MKTAWLFQAFHVCVFLTACATAAGGGSEEAIFAVGGRKSGGQYCFNRAAESISSPTVCHGTGGTYVTGLPRDHNWTRGSRILISKPIAPVGETTVGVAWVIQAHDRAATIHVIIGEPDQSLEGAMARPPRPDQRIRFENFYARMESREGKHVFLDVGDHDGVRKGDAYEARNSDRPDYPVGLVRVTHVYAMRAEAEVLQETDPFGVFHEFVLSPREDAVMLALQVGVVPVSTPDPQTRENHGFLLEKIGAMNTGPQTFGVAFEELRPARTPGTGARTDDIIVASARAQHVSQVVWAEGPCTTEPCARASYAVVPSAPNGDLVRRPLFFPSTSGGSVQNDTSAVLGQLAHAAQAFEEASYHLRTWAADESHTMTAEALLQLAEAEQELGQYDRARIWLRSIEGSPARGGQLLRYFQARGRGACADANRVELEKLEKSARTRLDEHPELKHFTLEALECKVALSLAAGNSEDAWPLIDQSIAVAVELGDQESITRLTAQKASLFELAGRFDEAQQTLRHDYEVAVTARDLHAQANNRLAQARNRIRAGEFTSARSHAQAALELFKSLEDDDGIVECLPVLVRIHRQLDGIVVARKFLDTERPTLKRRQLPRAGFALRLAGTYLDLQQGELVRASKDLKNLQAHVSKQRRSDEEIQILEMQSELLLLTGQMQQAHRTIDYYWHRASELHRPADLARARLVYAEFRLQEGNWRAAHRTAKEALAQYQTINDHAGVAAAEFILGEGEREFGKVTDARRHYVTAKQSFQRVQDADGERRADLGLAALELWREGPAHARQTLLRIESHFKKVGNDQDLMRTRLQLEWAKFLYARDHVATLHALKTIRDEAKRKRFVAFHAGAQMLIACVYRTDSDHKAAKHEFGVAIKLYAEMGRHTQAWPCEAGPEPLSGKALATVR